MRDYINVSENNIFYMQDVVTGMFVSITVYTTLFTVSIKNEEE